MYAYRTNNNNNDNRNVKYPGDVVFLGPIYSLTEQQTEIDQRCSASIKIMKAEVVTDLVQWTNPWVDTSTTYVEKWPKAKMYSPVGSSRDTRLLRPKWTTWFWDTAWSSVSTGDSFSIEIKPDFQTRCSKEEFEPGGKSWDLGICGKAVLVGKKAVTKLRRAAV